MESCLGFLFNVNSLVLDGEGFKRQLIADLKIYLGYFLLLTLGQTCMSSK